MTHLNPLTLGSLLIGLAKRVGFGHKFRGTDGKPTIRTLASPKPMENQELTRHFQEHSVVFRAVRALN
jgi:hypothetical protein